MEFLEVPLFDDDLFKLLVRFVFNIVFLSAVVGLAIYPAEQKRDFAFTVTMMNIMVFFICFTLKKLDLGLGMALGLFAVFAVLRFRTDSIRTKEMSYLFVVIGIAVLNSLSNKKTSYAELLAVNSIILISSIGMERFCARGRQPVPEPKGPKPPSVTYGNMDLIQPARRPELLVDLCARTGFNVIDVRVKSIDLKKSTAQLTLICDDSLTEKPEEDENSDTAPESVEGA